MRYVVGLLKRVAGTDARFPVRRVRCVGRNDATPARATGHGPDRRPPFFCMTPADAPVAGGVDVPCPAATSDRHIGTETIGALGKGSRDVLHVRIA